ncbi:hypothetical protein BT63DRAFT_405830 [Microthyrium microscopicum]|uniref:Integral membrane protein n=1 Tax=Microthyrium microscopicum TaxID=703497 RepID=A0A6A6U2X9_9PEZI|nr:hypothetical protein BT63DRAFT_405830 [Microthyrium microscopicum]
MPRSSTFAEQRLPLQQHDFLLPVLPSANGPFTFLNPTRLAFTRKPSGSSTDQPQVTGHSDYGDHDEPAEDVGFKWTSRNNRKGRHQIEFTPAKDEKTARYSVPRPTSSPQEVLKNALKMFTDYPVWDISWLVAYIFVWGSIIWIINAFFVWLPLPQPGSEFPNEIYAGGGITAFIGATIFEVGSILLILEAVNENQEGCWGWAVEELFEDSKPHWRLSPSDDACTHHHGNRRNLVGKYSTKASSAGNEVKNGTANGEAADSKTTTGKRSWVWFPTWKDLRQHYFYELGFLACLCQLFGASIFWISGFTALPGIYNHLKGASLNGAYWAPQIIGGSGFIISGLLFMLETQDKWYKPAFGVLGWHIGFWNCVGGIGFTMCPAFGLDTASWAVYESGLATFWGSWAFMIASVLQLYESLQKHPVDLKSDMNTKKDGQIHDTEAS